MELALNQQYLNHYEMVLTRTITHEESAEAIVPDAKPDILQITGTEGRVNLKAKQAQEGRCELAGIIGVATVYQPEGEGGLEKMESAIPFVTVVDDSVISSAARIVAEPTVIKAETRLLNPRKVLIRAEICITLRIYMPESNTICASVEAVPEAGIEQRSVCESAYVVTAVEEKAFSLTEDLTITGTRPAASSVLKYRTSLISGENKVIGNKLVLKGEILLQALYCSVEDTIENIQFSLPFSQIIEVSGVGESAQATVCLYQTDIDCKCSYEDGRVLQFSIGLLAQAVVTEQRTYCMLEDIYSTEHILEAEKKNHRFDQLVELAERSQLLREIVETRVLPVGVLDAYATTGPVSIAREQTQHVISCEVTAHLLYAGDDGNLYDASHTFQVPQTIEGGSGCSCLATARVVGEVSAVPAAGGIEVRIPIMFSYETVSPRTLASVSDVRIAGQRERGGAHPSVVLRSVGRESLWDIAKGYGITRQDIMQANGIEAEEHMQNQILLIPGKR